MKTATETKSVLLNLPDATAIADVVESVDNPGEALHALGRLFGEAAARCQRLARICHGRDDCRLRANRSGVWLSGDESFAAALVGSGVAREGGDA